MSEDGFYYAIEDELLDELDGLSIEEIQAETDNITEAYLDD